MDTNGLVPLADAARRLGRRHVRTLKRWYSKGFLPVVITEGQWEVPESFLIKVEANANVDIAGKQTRSVKEFLKRGGLYSYVITVCDETSAERCPIFPGTARRLHWGFVDPSKFEGTFEEKLAKTRAVRDQIKQKIKDFLA